MPVEPESQPADKDSERPDWMVPYRLMGLLEGPDEVPPDALEQARALLEERDEYEALEGAVLDLVKLERYERRAWSRQKRAGIQPCIGKEFARALRRVEAR